MSVPRGGEPSPRGLDRLADRILDRDGDLYGAGPRERTRWYEGIAIAASLHWLLLPWLLAVLVWFAGAGTAHALLAVVALTLLPILVMERHVRRGGIDTEPARWTGGRIALCAAYALPYPVFLAGYLRASGIGFDGAVEGAISAVVVVTVLSVIGLLLGRRRRGEPEPRR